MFVFGVLIILMLFACWVYYFKEEKAISKLFINKDTIPINTLMRFSNEDFVDCIIKYNQGFCKINVEYADKKYFQIDAKDSKKDILLKLEQIQKTMIEKRYNPDGEYIIKDKINKIIYDIWLDYSYKETYRKIFKEQVHAMFENDELSRYEFNEVSRRFTVIDMNDL